MRRYHQPRLSGKTTWQVYLVPAIGLAGVTTLASVLILLVVLRAVPGMGRIFSPDTHSNLWEEVKPGYDRTEVALLAGPVGGAFPSHSASALLPEGLSPRDMGERLFSGVGCAMCHGIEGKGGTFAPPVAGANPQIVQAMVRFGPGGMPVFSPDVLSDEDLSAITVYLQSLEAPVRLTPTPKPSQGEPTPQAPGQQELAPEVLGQRLFSSLSCAVCHGSQAQGSGFAPPLAGASPETVLAIVRSGRGGMPAFSENALSQDGLEGIIAYLQSLKP
ncbi:MAG: cystathionine beta-lyase [Dehalococcoidia bacterium]|nr:cystathionine beta-lyase [Dehalococcoidia bacterium]